MKFLAVIFVALATGVFTTTIEGRRRPSGGDHHNHAGNGWGSSSTGRPASSTAPPTTTTAPPTGDTRSLHELYQLALAEGGRLVVYAGGDSLGSQDGTKARFEQEFPGVTLDTIVDLSKFHDGRIDYQLEEEAVVVDVAHLQMVHDFPRWKEQGVLLNYRPIGWEEVYDEMKDDGWWYGMAIYSFSNLINNKLLPDNSSWPVNAQDYLKPEFKGEIVATWPNDDDAVLYMFKQIVDKYGWGWVRAFKEQNVTFVRGTGNARLLVTNGTFQASFTTGGGLIYTGGDTNFVIPESDPFVFWPQIGAIFKDAPHPNAAKLYMSWLLEQQRLASGQVWSVRKDSLPPPGFRAPLEYTQTTIMGFADWMANRHEVELFRTKISLILGEVQGESPTSSNELGLSPTVALPH